MYTSNDFKRLKIIRREDFAISWKQVHPNDGGVGLEVELEEHSDIKCYAGFSKITTRLPACVHECWFVT